MSISVGFRDRWFICRGCLFCESSRGGGRSCLDRFGGRDIGRNRNWLRGRRRLGVFSLLLGRCRNLVDLSGSLLWLAFVALSSLFFEEAEDVVEDKVTIGLLSEEESLNKLFPRLVTIRHFTNHLNDDATVGRGLCID
jgi:hypothetical protein